MQRKCRAAGCVSCELHAAAAAACRLEHVMTTRPRKLAQGKLRRAQLTPPRTCALGRLNDTFRCASSDRIHHAAAQLHQSACAAPRMKCTSTWIHTPGAQPPASCSCFQIDIANALGSMHAHDAAAAAAAGNHSQCSFKLHPMHTRQTCDSPSAAWCASSPISSRLLNPTCPGCTRVLSPGINNAHLQHPCLGAQVAATAAAATAAADSWLSLSLPVLVPKPICPGCTWRQPPSRGMHTCPASAL